jgi:hypothetical protein
MDEQLKEKVRVKAMSSLLHRNVLGALGMLLPVFSIIGGLFVRNKPESWWYSISVTYYITPALPIILGSCGIFLLCYRSYEKIDTIINVLSGIFAFGVVLFPCANPYGIERVGYFQLPVGVSDIIHCASAMILFALLAFNIGWLFTRGQNDLNNKIYRICSYSMIAIMGVFFIVIIAGFFGLNYPKWLTMVVEAALLLLFGFAWLVKGKLFKFN